MSDNKVGITSLYDINKQGFNNVPPIQSGDLYNRLCAIGDWFKDKKYCMLLCRERYDYTVFNFIKGAYKQAATNDLRECMDGRGKCLDVIYEDDRDAWEIWMRIDGDVYMYLLFDCYGFIVEV